MLLQSLSSISSSCFLALRIAWSSIAFGACQGLGVGSNSGGCCQPAVCFRGPLWPEHVAQRPSEWSEPSAWCKSGHLHGTGPSRRSRNCSRSCQARQGCKCHVAPCVVGIQSEHPPCNTSCDDAFAARLMRGTVFGWVGGWAVIQVGNQRRAGTDARHVFFSWVDFAEAASKRMPSK